MKKTLFLLLALPGIAAAVDAYTLVSKSITFKDTDTNPVIDSNTLTKKNASMVWDEKAVYNNWYMEFSLTEVTCTGYQATITAGGWGGGNANGLSVLAEKNETGYAITLGSGTSALDGNKSLSFNTSDTITFAFFNGSAYLEIKSANNTVSDNYITCTPKNITVTMTSGDSRAWTNGDPGKTQIGTTTIASLDSIKSALAENETLDMAKLMTTGVAVATLTETGTGEEESTYWVGSLGNQTVWSDEQGYFEDEGYTETQESSFKSIFKFNNGRQEDATANKDKTLVLNLGDAANGTVHDLGSTEFCNHVLNEAGNTKQLTSDDANASPQTYSYGILKLADNANIRLGASGSVTNKNNWSTVGSLRLGAGAKLALDGRKFIVSGLPYVSMDAGSQIELKSGAQLSLGVKTDDKDEQCDSVTFHKADNATVGSISNSTTGICELGTPTAADVELRHILVEMTGKTDMTVAAKMGDSNLWKNCPNVTLTVTGQQVEGSDRAIRRIRSGDGFSAGQGGGITLLNRGTDPVQLETLYIGKENTVIARQGADTNTEKSLVKIDAYRYRSGDCIPDSGDHGNGLISYKGAALDADLELGLGDLSKAVIFSPHTYLTEGCSPSKDYGLNMAGNDVTLKAGIALHSYYTNTQVDGTTYMLFSNVGSLTLDGYKFDNEYFSVDDADFYKNNKMFASKYFSYTGTVLTWYASIVNPSITEEGVSGWFIEYKPNSVARSGEAATGDVYLTYKVIKFAEDNVPEPTTATLSLLALAALAARRRRK